MSSNREPEIKMARVEALYGNSIFHVMARNVRDVLGKTFRSMNSPAFGRALLGAGITSSTLSFAQGEQPVIGAFMLGSGLAMVGMDLVSKQRPKRAT